MKAVFLVNSGKYSANQQVKTEVKLHYNNNNNNNNNNNDFIRVSEIHSRGWNHASTNWGHLNLKYAYLHLYDYFKNIA